jgi:transcriptional regulator with XRE-family HTH domain
VAGNPNAFVARVVRELAAIRRAKGITNEQLAERLDTAEQNVRRIMRGQNMTLRMLSRVCTSLGVNPEVTFTDDPRGAQTPTPGRRRARR